MISVLIATYNRSKDLKVVLDCLQKQDVLELADYEVLIIDNNSHDDTKSVVESVMPSFQGKLRYLFEPRQGKSYAVNLGIKEARGEIVVLTDDDCTFDRDYLMNVFKAFEDSGPLIGFVGGKILPRWVNCTKPEWFVDLKPGWWFKGFFWGPLGILDYGEESFILGEHGADSAEGKLFYGANLAVRREIFGQCGVLSLEKSITEDTELQLRFLRKNVRGLYAPQIRVYHKILPRQLTAQHFYRWYFSRGLFLEVQEKYKKKIYHPLGIQLTLMAETLRLAVASIFARSMTDKIYKRSHALFNFGQMLQIARKNMV